MSPEREQIAAELGIERCGHCLALCPYCPRLLAVRPDLAPIVQDGGGRPTDSPPHPSRAHLALVAHCLYRGASLPVSEQPECGCGGELYRCHAGYGPAGRPHAATTRECLACVAERIIADG